MTEQEIDECKRILARRKKAEATAAAVKGAEAVVIAAPVKRESMHSLFDRERRVLVGKNSNLEYYQTKVWA